MSAPDPQVSGVTAARSPMQRRQRIAVATLWLAAIGGYWLWSSRSQSGPSEHLSSLVDVLQTTSWGALLYVAVYLVRPLLLLSATLLTIAGGFLYGPVWGLVVVIVASNASAMVAYAVGRWFGGHRDQRDAPRFARLGRYVERLRTRGFETTVILRLLLMPYDLVSYAAGLARVSPGAFLAGTAIGSIPGTVAIVLFGASIERFDGALPEIDGRMVAASAGLLAISLLMVRVVRQREGITPDEL